MCMDCFRQYTDKPVINERVVGMVTFLKQNHEFERSMLLHVIIDDMNLDDERFDLTDPEIREDYDLAGDRERQAFHGLAAMSEAERATAVALAWGYDLSGQEQG